MKERLIVKKSIIGGMILLIIMHQKEVILKIPYNPVTRIRELKEAITSHANKSGMSVIMDVVYNHMYVICRKIRF